MSNSFCQQKTSGLFGDMVILGGSWEKPTVKLGYVFTLSKKTILKQKSMSNVKMIQEPTE